MSCVHKNQKAGLYSTQFPAACFDEEGVLIENLCDMGYTVVEKITQDHPSKSYICVSWHVARITDL